MQAVKFRKERFGRRPYSKRLKEAIIEKQGGSCFYCGIAFGEWFMHRNRLICVKVHWDHFVPFSYCFRNDSKNYVAACSECNLIKTSHMFDSTQDTIDYVRKRRTEKGLPLLPLPSSVHQKEEMAKVLLGKLSNEKLLEKPRRCTHCGAWNKPDKFRSTIYCSERCSKDAAELRAKLRIGKVRKPRRTAKEMREARRASLKYCEDSMNLDDKSIAAIEQSASNAILRPNFQASSKRKHPIVTFSISPLQILL